MCQVSSAFPNHFKKGNAKNFPGNFERLLWYLAFDVYGEGSTVQKQEVAGKKVKDWLLELKKNGGFGAEPRLLEAARVDFDSERISDQQTLLSIKNTYRRKAFQKSSEDKGTVGTVSQGGYILDPHSAIGVAAAYLSIKKRPETQHVALATAHPAKFSKAVEEALKDAENFQFQNILPEQFRGLEELPRRKSLFKKSDGLDGMRKEIRSRVPASGLL